MLPYVIFDPIKSDASFLLITFQCYLTTCLHKHLKFRYWKLIPLHIFVKTARMSGDGISSVLHFFTSNEMINHALIIRQTRIKLNVTKIDGRIIENQLRVYVVNNKKINIIKNMMGLIDVNNEKVNIVKTQMGRYIVADKTEHFCSVTSRYQSRT